MEIKVNGRLTKISGTATFKQLKEKMKKPHICSNCGVVACVGGRNLKNVAIKNAIKSKNGVYVLDCDDYIEDKTKNTNVKSEGQPYFSSPSECSIMHPTVKHALFR